MHNEWKAEIVLKANWLLFFFPRKHDKRIGGREYYSDYRQTQESQGKGGESQEF